MTFFNSSNETENPTLPRFRLQRNVAQIRQHFVALEAQLNSHSSYRLHGISNHTFFESWSKSQLKILLQEMMIESTMA